MPSRMSIGNAELVGVLDMIPPTRDPTAFFNTTTHDSWAPYADDVLEEGRLQLYFGCFFVRTPDKCVLVDTGMGPGPTPTARTAPVTSSTSSRGRASNPRT